MMLRAHPLLRADLWPEPPIVRDDVIEFACRLELSDGRKHRLWYRFPAAQQTLLTTRADPFLVATLVYAMRYAQVLRIHGGVSAELLANIDEFQHAFSAFHRDTLRPVAIEATRIDETIIGQRRSRGLTAFSAGVDGAFTLWRHTALSHLQPKRPLHAALVMQGFDIAHDDHATFAEVVARCRRFTDDARLVLHTGSTNLRTLKLVWDQHFGTAVAASLMFFQSAYSFGVVPSAYSFRNLHLENGSNPLTDPLLSSPLMTIMHDGASHGRIDKLRALAEWPCALENLRVCWQSRRAGNCCRCEKCVRTMLMLNLCGVERCAAFPRPLIPSDLDRLSIPTPGGANELAYLLEEAHRAGRRDAWLGPLERAIVRNRRYQRLQGAAREAGGAIPRSLRLRLASLAKHLLRQSPPRPPDDSGTPFIGQSSVKSS